MKKVLIAVICAIVLCAMATSVLAVWDPGYNSDLVHNALKGKTQNVWATVVVLVQILSVGCVVFAGLRYMFASADIRADIKRGLIYLMIGAILVFGATLIIQLVAFSAKNVIVP